jgi:hypothetical protein
MDRCSANCAAAIFPKSRASSLENEPDEKLAARRSLVFAQIFSTRQATLSQEEWAVGR